MEIVRTIKNNVHKKTTCIIVSFNKHKKLKNVVQKIISQVNNIIIVDNNSNLKTKLVINSLVKIFPRKITVILNKKNYYFSKAANLGIKEAISRGAKYILQLNNDTYLSKNAVSKMMEYYENDKQKKIGILAPMVKIGKKTASELLEETKETSLIADNGMLIPSRVFRHIGFYDEDLAMGYQDYDLTLRAISYGYRCLTISKIYWYANLGDMEKRYIFWMPILVFHYPPMRRYYAARNGLYLIFRWYKSFALIKFVLRWEIYNLIGIIFFEKNKFQKISLTFLGYFDACRSKMGDRL
jgi:rhamnosyltransferase